MLVERQYKIRLDTFNFIKGILIILIVLGHKLPHYDIESNALFKILILPPCLGLNGCNPAFFIIAGFLFRAMPNMKCLKKTSSGGPSTVLRLITISTRIKTSILSYRPRRLGLKALYSISFRNLVTQFCIR